MNQRSANVYDKTSLSVVKLKEEKNKGTVEGIRYCQFKFYKYFLVLQKMNFLSSNGTSARGSTGVLQGPPAPKEFTGVLEGPPTPKVFTSVFKRPLNLGSQRPTPREIAVVL